MALVRWEPIRLFNTFFDTPTTGNGGGNALRRWIPATDLVETDDHFVLKVDLPGLTEADVNVEVKDNVLTLSGERKAEHEDKREGYVRVERAFGSFSRSVELPAGVKADDIVAEIANGVLKVTVQKPAPKQAKQIDIKAAA